MKKGKGRPINPIVQEAKNYVLSDNFNVLLLSIPISEAARDRLKKAVYFGLGIKVKENGDVLEKINNVFSDVLSK